MNVGEIRNLAKKLVNSYSSEGQTLPLSDNADMDLVIVDHLNTAQNKFAEKDKIEASTTITQVASDDGFILYPLPTDLVEINKVIFLDAYKNRSPFSDYTEEMGNMVIPSNYEGTFYIYYYKRPDDLVEDTDVPEIQSQYHRYLAYFAAGTWLFSTGKENQGMIYLNIFDGFLRESIPKTESGTGIINVSNW